MSIRAVVKQIFTGPDNETVAWGRVMGGAVFALFVILLPQALLVAVALKAIASADATAILAALVIYVPAMSLSAAGLVAGTAFAEGRAPVNGQDGAP